MSQNNSSYKPDFADWYQRMGVSPPTADLHGIQDDIIARLKEKVPHGDWKQRGNFITCNNCPNPHSHSIPTNLILTGTDAKGLPQLKNLDERA